MITIDKLKAFGADTEDALERCMGNETLYLKLIGKCLEDPSFEALDSAVSCGDLAGAFELAHSLKGVLGNLSLTPLYAPVSEMTEILRKGESAGLKSLMSELIAQRDELLRLFDA